MLSKLGFRVQMDAKSGELKNESKTEIFGAPGDAQVGEGKGGHSVLYLKAHLVDHQLVVKHIFFLTFLCILKSSLE